MNKILVLDFGGQYSHLISRRIRDLGVACEVLLGITKAPAIKKISNLKGIILSGGAASVYDKNSPKCDKAILKLGLPVLGICYGHQLIVYLEGGKVEPGRSGEYGMTELKILRKSSLLSLDCRVKPDNDNYFRRPLAFSVWMNHQDIVKVLPRGYKTIASTEKSPVAVFVNQKKKIYGIQFHPEVTHTQAGQQILKNFVFKVCRAEKSWGTDSIIKDIITEAKSILQDKKAIIGLSGGVDSSTAAILIRQVIGKNLTAVYIDTGLMRYQETEFIKRVFSKYDLNLKIIRAGKIFFKTLKNITKPEAKRKIIGKLFIDIFNEAAKKEKADFLIQGTIYSDRIESGLTQYSSKIKSHHNVGGLPKKMKLKVYEPLRNLYKDEVRRIAQKLGLPDEIMKRHVFPGPGLAVRIIGQVTPKKVQIVRQASYIIEQELKSANIFNKVWMAFAVLLLIKTVGIQGDSRTYKYPLVIRIIESKDAMTANFSKIPYAILEKISTRITNEVQQVNRVVYDISNKPPATMEWE